jgi:hypothetical protein
MSHVSTTPPTIGSSLLSARHSFSCDTCPLGWCTSTENAGTLRITNTTTAANQPCAMSATVSVTNDTRQPTEDGVTCQTGEQRGRRRRAFSQTLIVLSQVSLRPEFDSVLAASIW